MHVHERRPWGWGRRPRHQVADVFRTHGADYRRAHWLTPAQLKVMHAIEACRTEKLGGHLYVCDECHHEIGAYNSCRDRHCPTCQGLNQARWIEKRKERVLDIGHFHVVFTLPKQLRPLVFHNRKKLFDLLFEAAAGTLLELGRDPKRLGVHLGISTVLHTWTRKLTFHPHVHCVVTAGGLAVSGSERFIHSSHRYLFNLKVMGKLFCRKFLDGLRRLYDAGELELVGSCEDLEDAEAFRIVIDSLYRKEWVVYSKPPFGGAAGVFEYLGRYTHRVGISDHRVVHICDDHVTFRTKGDGLETTTLQEFIRRFLLHVLPKGFVKIRHFGLMASANVNTKLVRAHQLLGSKTPSDATVSKPRDWLEHLLILTGIDLRKCPVCQAGRMHPRPLPRVLDTS